MEKKNNKINPYPKNCKKHNITYTYPKNWGAKKIIKKNPYLPYFFPHVTGIKLFFFLGLIVNLKKHHTKMRTGSSVSESHGWPKWPVSWSCPSLTVCPWWGGSVWTPSPLEAWRSHRKRCSHLCKRHHKDRWMWKRKIWSDQCRWGFICGCAK